ncbi:hypothetical protein LSH36_237g01005 [Paralvinella palmiformis]|uniref:Uncharacterized protein n=1 Tax=Paralvinella palmiformis TaxID=53620 RepID=A0AAD9N4V7_9ANNE|nr:hypothetical protein LSH36_237g01005 [Paralvinella palmiformis]
MTAKRLGCDVTMTMRDVTSVYVAVCTVYGRAVAVCLNEYEYLPFSNPVKTVGDQCTSHGECPRDLDCHNNKCTCTGKLIDMYCKKPYEVLLGDECGEVSLEIHGRLIRPSNLRREHYMTSLMNRK